MSEEATVGADALDDTLNSLLAAAESTDLTKGGVENSGTHGSEGPQGGGQGSESCPIDNMMIAKMIQSGVDVQTAAQFAAFMKGEGEDEDEDEDGPFGKSAGFDPAEAGEALAKSFRENLAENLDDDANAMVDVTPYLDGMIQTVGEQLGSLHKSIDTGHASQNKINKGLARAVHQMGGLLKSQAKVIEALAVKLNIVEKAPVATPKGITGTAAPMVKSGMGGGSLPQLTKSNTLSTLSYMNLVKGGAHKNIGGRSTSDIITGLEAGGIFDEQSQAAVESFLKSCTPDEQAEALNF